MMVHYQVAFGVQALVHGHPVFTMAGKHPKL